MKSYKIATFCTALALIISGCSQTKPTPKEGEDLTDETLPLVKMTQNGVVTDSKEIAFEWKEIQDPRVKGIYIYKKTIGAKTDDKKEIKSSYYDTVNNRFSTHYLDTKVSPNTKYEYYFKTFSDKGESQKSQILHVTSKPVPQSVSWLYCVEGMPRSAKLIWRPHPNQKVKAYIIERKALEDDKWEKIATIQGRLSAEYIDTGLKDRHVYKYRIRVATYDGLISTPSEIVKIITKALPNPVVNFQASKDLPKKIKLKWDMCQSKDFDRYYLYRSEDVDGDYKLIAKLHRNSFTDEIKEDGKRYFYRVSCVDDDGLESPHKHTTILGMSRPKPLSPSLIEANLQDNQIKLMWVKPNADISEYVLIKKTKINWIKTKTKEIKGITTTSYVDTNIAPDTTYIYQVYGIDKYGIKSEPSVSVKIKTDKDLRVQKPAIVKTTKKIAKQQEEEMQEEVIPANDF